MRNRQHQHHRHDLDPRFVRYTRRPRPAASFAAAAVALLLASNLALAHSGPSLTINAADRPLLSGCEDVDLHFGAMGGSWETARSTEKIAVPAGEATPLRARMSASGGMRVQPWDQAGYEVEVCKAAAAKDLAGAQKILDEVRVERRGGTITSSGPEEKNRWAVYLILRVPKGASVDLETTNGEIGLRGVEGTIVARSQNGPIHLQDCSGDVQARAQNGPVAVGGGSGKYDMSTQNGPVAVALSGTTWEGAGLSAETSNGPVALTLPPDYATGVRVEVSGNSPYVCSGPGCAAARKVRREGRRSVSFGGEEPVIRLKTGNGPVAIESKDENDDEGEQGVF